MINSIMEAEKARRNYAIDILKVILCFGVAISHVNYTFYFENASKETIDSVLVYFFNSPLMCLFNGSLNVYIFCCISGFFAAKKKILNFKTFIKVCICRYINFFIPIVIVNSICVFLWYNNLIKKEELGIIFNNEWIKSNYIFEEISLMSFFKACITFSSTYNQPLWMLPSLFAGNILCYLNSFFRSKYLSYSSLFMLVPLSVLSVICFQIKSIFPMIVLCTFSGVFVQQFFNFEEKHSNKVIRNIEKYLFIIIFFVVGNIRYNNRSLVHLILYCLSGFVLTTLFILFSKKETINRILNGLKNISFEIYIIHFPLFLYWGGVIEGLYERLSFTTLYFVTLLIFLVSCIIAAFALHKAQLIIHNAIFNHFEKSK